jgi:nucleotide-binding universal stress UspA family protein
VTRDEPYVDFLVVGSRPEAPAGRVMISSHTQKVIENATSPVLVLPHRVTVRLPLATAA